MTDHLEIVTPRTDKDGKTRWLKIGAMFRAKREGCYAIKLDALPLPNDKGEIWLQASPPLPRDDDEPRAPAPARERPTGFPERPRPSTNSLDDDIPF